MERNFSSAFEYIDFTKELPDRGTSRLSQLVKEN